MEPIHVLVSAKATAYQLERMNDLHPRLKIHGEPGGYAIVNPNELDHKPIDYPEERPDVDIESLLAKAEVLIASRIPSDVTIRAPKLRWIQVTSAGIDHLWKPCLDDSTIIVTTARGIHAVPISEFVLGCMLVFAKGILRMVEQKRAHLWQKFLLEELKGKTIVMVGFGEIGQSVALVANKMGLRTIGVRRKEGRVGISGVIDDVVTPEKLSEVLPLADYVVCCLPLTTKTERFFGESAFRAMKPTAVFMNVGRGRTIDQGFLIQALKDRWIAGAALDTFEQEPLPPNSPLWDFPNVLVSPHMSADTPLYMERMTDMTCDNLKRYAEGRSLRNVIDRVERY